MLASTMAGGERRPTKSGTSVVFSTSGVAKGLVAPLPFVQGGTAFSYYLCWKRAGQNNDFVLGHTGALYAYLQYAGNWYVGNEAQSVPMANDVVKIKSCRSDNASEQVRATNGVAHAATAAQSADASTIGATDAYAGPLDGTIYELRAYDARLSDAADTQTIDYLKAKWADVITFDAGESPGERYVRLFTGLGTIDWNGVTWTGGGDLLAISPIEELAAVEAVGFSVTVSGIDSNDISRALNSMRQGYPGKLWLGLFDSSNQLIDDPYMLRRGKFDITVIERTGETCTIQVNYEDRLIDLERPRGGRYTSADQQARYPTDRGFDFVPSLQDMQILWK
ncbi:MAG: hypothetical protein HY661_02430 [Betaproteobacteria bacterium]|nr:hypothetical protein [Betaproteobacteria bacterium]